MGSEAFRNVKNQIGYCGIWCGSCPGGHGVSAELTKKYADFVKKSQLQKWAPKTFDLSEFMKGLSAIQTMPSCAGCLKGGGNPTCKVRTCASKKKIVNCSQCDQLSTCENFETLEKTHPNIKEDLRKMRNIKAQELLKKWANELRRKWPHCILLCPSSQSDKIYEKTGSKKRKPHI